MFVIVVKLIMFFFDFRSASINFDRNWSFLLLFARLWYFLSLLRNFARIQLETNLRTYLKDEEGHDPETLS